MGNITENAKNKIDVVQEREGTTRNWYDIEKVMSYNCDYTLIDGQKGNGKTDSALRYMMKLAYPTSDFIYLRRMEEDIKPKNGVKTMFDAIVDRGFVKHLTNGDYDRVAYYNGEFFYAKEITDNKGNTKIVRSPDSFCRTMCLSKYEHYTGKPFLNTCGIYFDEFIPKDGPLYNEFAKFLDLCHSVRRDKTNFKVIMTANLNNVSNLYFTNFGVNRKQKQGTIAIYTDKNNGRTVAREYCSVKESSEEIERMFSFDDDRFNMILTGKAITNLYPPFPFVNEDGRRLPEARTLYKYYIQFEIDCYECEIIQCNDEVITFVHPKTSPFQSEEELIFSQNCFPSLFRRVNLWKPIDDIGKRIKWFYDADKVFYSDNDTGEMIHNYKKWCNLHP